MSLAESGTGTGDIKAIQKLDVRLQDKEEIQKGRQYVYVMTINMF
jgi:hypothetical protein